MIIRMGQHWVDVVLDDGACHCGQPPRGNVAETPDGVPAHYCRQCCADHCEMAAYIRRSGAGS